MADGSRSFDSGVAEAASVTALYRAHSAYVWRVLRHCGVPDDDLDDAVQEVFLVVVRRLSEFEGRASIRTWIYAVATRVASTRRRSRQREVRRRDRAGAQMHGSSVVDPEAELSRVEAAELVDRLLDDLDPPKRTVFVLAEIEGVKVPEISRILGVNPRTVHSRLRLARERFGNAVRRLEAQEQGARRVARLRSRALLDEAANDRPAARRRKAVCAALVLRVEQGATPVLPGWETLGGSTVGGSGSLGLVAVVVAGTALVTWAAVSPWSRPQEPSSAKPAVARAAVGVASAERSAAPVDPADRSESAAETEPVLAPVLTPAARPARDRPVRRSKPTRVEAKAPTEPESAPSDSPVSTLTEETRLLEQARSALRRGQPDAALAAIGEHLDRFPRGVLADEARSTRLRALCAAGRDSEAHALADRLANGAKDSRWHQIVQARCSS